MNKLFTKIAGLSIGLAMAIGVGVAVGSNSKEASPAQAASPASVTFSELSLGNGHVMSGSDVSLENGLITFAWDKGSGSTAPTYYDSGTSVRLYCPKSSNSSGLGGKVTISLTDSDYYITSITYSFGGTVTSKGVVTAGSKASVEHSISSSGTVTTATYTSSDNVQSVVFQAKNTNSSTKQCYLSGVSVSYGGGSTSVSVTGVSVSPTAVSIGVGGTQQLTPTITPSNATDKTVTYSSSATAIATVSSTGLITAVTAGSATITVTTHDGGFKATCAVTVTAPKTPASLATTGQTTSFETGNTFTYGGTSTVTYTDSTSKSVTPSSFKIGNAGINPISAGTVIVPGTTVLNRNDHHGKTVYVLYEENSTTVYASYTISVAAISKISFVGGTDTGTASGQSQSDTLTKSGISMSCDSCYTKSGAYRFYSGSTLTISSTVGNIAKIEFNMNGSYNSNLLSTSTGTYNHDDSSKGVWTGDAASIAFDLSAQARCNSVDITLASNDPLVELAPASSSEVSMFKGDTDTSVKVLVKNIDSKTWNFTFDEDEQEGITTSSYISVSAGAGVSDVHTLTITTKAVGSTTLHISVSGTACAASVPVTVAAKPASMTIVHGDIHEGELEIITGEHKQVSFSGLDTDGNPYSIAAADVTPSATSGASHVTLSGSRITGASEGTAVVRYTLNALTSVYAEITVNVVDDYIESVGEPTFATGLTDTQGQSPDVSVFTSRPGTMHSGSSTTVPFENYKFSYTESYVAAEYGSVFSYDFSHGETVDSTHKLQTIYVFCDIDEAAHGSYTVTVEQFNDPLQTITFTNITNHAVDVTRGSTFQLEWAYDPENPTDGKEVVFRVDDNTDNIDITVSSSGLISIGSLSNLGEAKVVIESAHKSSISDFVTVSATLESMKYTVREAESLTPVSTVSAGDRVYMVVDNGTKTYEFSGLSSTSTIYGEGAEYSTDIAKLQLLTVEAGASSGTVSFKMSDGNYLNWSSGNSLTSNSTKSNNTSWTVDGSTITNAADTTRQLWWNNGTPRFACYTNKTSTTGYYCPSFIKITGGDTEYDVTDTLFNGVHDNFGASKTYKWDASCSSFDEDAWLNACVALTEITDYSSYKLNKAVADLSGNEVEVFLAKYDAIIRKFGTIHDHLDRFSVGGINYGGAININTLQASAKSAGTTIAIIAISAVSLAAVGGYFLFRRRKEQ